MRLQEKTKLVYKWKEKIRNKISTICLFTARARWKILNFIKLFLQRGNFFFFNPLRFLQKIFILLLIFAWIFSGCLQIFTPLTLFKTGFPPEIQKIEALNKSDNWNFNGNSTGWTETNGSGSAVCGTNTTGSETNMATFAYDGTDGNPAGSFRAIGNTGNNATYRGSITQSITAPGSGNVKIKGRMDYMTSGNAWRTNEANSSWVRLDLMESNNSTFVAQLACASFTADVGWTTLAFSSDVILTGGTQYVIRVTFRTRNRIGGGSNTLRADNIVVNFAPTGLSASAPADTTNVSLSWSVSTAGSGAPGLHTTTPYKIYRDISSPVSTFLVNATTSSYTDSSTAGNTTYYYTVSDVDTNNIESPLSAEVSILTRPGVPTGLNFTDIQATALTVNWTAPTGGVGALTYKVYRCDGASCTPSETPIASGVTDLFYGDTSLTCNTLYRYRVRATNASGDGAYSSIAEETTAACGPSTAIEVRAQNYTSSVSIITFLEGAPGSTISQPYNDVDGSGNPQVFGGAGTAKPVVTLYNGGAGSLIIWYNITTFTNSIVSSEYYLVNNKGGAVADADAINNLATFDTNTTTGTTIAVGAGNEKDLYLKITLSSVAAKSGSSTLTILGETP